MKQDERNKGETDSGERDNDNGDNEGQKEIENNTNRKYIYENLGTRCNVQEPT
jgi:hypothetical protein